jgi:RND family efflux transporter MFP subunit
MRLAVLLAVVLATGGARRDAAAAGDGEDHRESATVWTRRGELFMEYGTPEPGRPVRFAVHLTRLDGWQPVARGRVRLALTGPGARSVETVADAPERPGIFVPVLSFPEAGEYRGTLVASGPDLEESFSLPAIRVGMPDPAARADPAAAAAAPPPAARSDADALHGEPVTFLKEQQWRIPFRTEPTGRRTLVHAVHAQGEVREKPGRSAVLSSPVDGRVVGSPPELGRWIEADQVVVDLAPFLSPDVDRPHLDQEVSEAQAELAQARATLARAESLVRQRAMPAKELVSARTQEAVARAKLKSADEHRLTYRAAQETDPGRTAASQLFQVRTPIAGEVTRVEVMRGQQVARDRLLVTIDDHRRIWVHARVFEPDLPLVREATGAVFSFPGLPRSFALTDLGGRIVLVGHHLEADSRTAPVIFEVDNPQHAVPIGGFVDVAILTRRSGSQLAVPVGAVVEDGARPVLYVQTGGEAFEKRPISTGITDRGWIAVTAGLREGERVVTLGAYPIKLSSMTGAIPEHGHPH